MTDACIFCQIIEKKSPATIVFEDERCLAILDIFPANPGHTLVMPKKHYSLLGEVPAEELTHAIEIVQKIGPAVQHAYRSQGYNVLVNNGTAAGQIVPHVHFHLVPRSMNDGKKFELPREQATPPQLAEAADKIKKELSHVKP